MLSGNLGSYIPGKPKGSRPKRNADRRAARRLVLKGFPISPRNFSRSEIKEYFNDDKIQCLLCGKAYKGLGQHLSKNHGIRVDEYRELYGLPYRTGLVGKATREAYKTASSTEDRKNHMRKLADKYRHLCHDKVQRKAPFFYEVSCDNLSGVNPPPQTYCEDDFHKVLKIMESKDMLLREVCLNNGTPSLTWCQSFKHNSKKAKIEYDRVLNNLSFDAQARGQCLGARFTKEVKKLYEDGCFFYQIAEKLGVTSMTVHKHVNKNPVDEHAHKR